MARVVRLPATATRREINARKATHGESQQAPQKEGDEEAFGCAAPRSEEVRGHGPCGLFQKESLKKEGDQAETCPEENSGEKEDARPEEKSRSQDRPKKDGLENTNQTADRGEGEKSGSQAKAHQEARHEAEGSQALA